VSTNVDAGTSSWIDQTGSINPSAFPISGIVLDSSDPTGLTAYVTIMGFHVSHIWKTTNGGASWTDFTGNLPDAPANAVLVDAGTNPLTGTVYVGTDVGVFSSLTSAASWTEVGPAPSSGETGYLPNVAVTALQMFNDGTDKWLRASTYGRGIWQFPLISTADFLISVSNTPLTVFAGSQGVFDGLVFALDGYAYNVNLSCSNGATAPPPTCTANPNTITPSSSGTSFSIITAGSDGTYSFTVQGIGTDPNSITHDAPLTLNVVDFNLTAPSPSSITVGPGATSAPVAFQVTAAGPFSQTVNLSCSGLPSGTACNFQPSSSVTPSASIPVNVTLTITTATNTPTGTSTITIRGSVVNGPTKTQGLSLTVVPGYSMAISNPSPTAYVNSTTQFTGTLTSLDGYNSLVNLSCGTGAPPTCTVAPASVTPNASGAPFTVTVGSNVCGQYSFNIVAQGTDTYAVSQSLPVTFTSTSFAPPDYTLEITNPSLTAPANTPATFNGTLTGTVCYNSPVTLSCGSGSPPTCSTPTSVTPTVQGTPFTVMVSTNQQCGAYNFQIVAQGTDPATITHSFLVTFTSSSVSQASYSLKISNTPLTVPINTPASFNGTLTGTTCYNSPVNLSCGSDHPPTCKPVPPTAIPTPSGTSFRVDVESNVAQSYKFDIMAAGTGPSAVPQPYPVIFGSSLPPFTFSLTSNTGPESIKAGETATYQLALTPSYGTFPSNVELSFTGCPPLSNCALSPTQVAAGKSAKTVTFTVQTTAAVVASAQPFSSKRTLYVFWVWLPGLMLTLCCGTKSRLVSRKRFLLLFLAVAIIALLSVLIACGGGLQGGGTASANPGTPAGPYYPAVKAVMNGAPTETASLTLTVD
jgi:hypothetical protein